MEYLTVEQHGGVTFIWFDQPDDKINTLNETLFEAFNEVLDQIDADNDCLAAVLISRKRDCFIAGADIEMLRRLDQPGQGSDLSRRGHAMLDKIAASSKPFVAAINGAALGGGLEVALACHYRIATTHPKTVLGLPEVKLGLLPGAGGTQRLPQLIGLQKALDILLTGKNVYPAKAKKIGLVDLVVEAPALYQSALAFAQQVAKKPTPRKDRRGRMERLLEGNPLTRSIIYRTAGKKAYQQTQGNYPAPALIIDCVRAAMDGKRGKGYEVEAQHFDTLIHSPESRELTNLFFAMTSSKKHPLAENAKQVKKLGILGAGLMGAGIAEVSAAKGIRVAVKERNQQALTRGEKMMWKNLDKQVKRRIITPHERDVTWSHIHPTTHYGDLARSELIVEAVFEDLDLKRKVLAEVEEHISPTCVFASNTSSLPISAIARDAKHPERVIGMHYFSPVPKMPLLEIIVTKQTADWAVASAVATGIRQGKTVIVVNDGPGFYTTRILAPLLNEALLLLLEGGEIKAIDRTMKRFGFPVGPITLMDEVGIDVGWHVSEVLADLFARRGVEPNPVYEDIFKAGYLGRKNGKGFYRYNARGKPVNEDIYYFFGGHNRKPLPEKEIQERLSMVMVNEAAYCLQEDILRNPADGDLGAILGLGFPPFLGGPFRYLDRFGSKKALVLLEQLQDRHGGRFTPSQLIRDHAAAGKPFYPASS